MEEVQCEDCGWQGHPLELLCTDEDYISDKPSGEIEFNLCPECESDNVVEVE